MQSIYDKLDMSEAYAPPFEFGFVVNPHDTRILKHEAVLRKHAKVIATEMACKPEIVQPQRGFFNIRDAMQVYRWCMDHDVAFRWQTAVWNFAFWMNQDRSKASAQYHLREHLKFICREFPGVAMFEVNETTGSDPAVKYGARPDSPWKKLKNSGAELWWVRTACDTIAEFAPKALICANDQGADSSAEKLITLRKFLEYLKATKTPVHVVGNQCHWSRAYVPLQGLLNIQALAAEFGLDVADTETTMSLYDDKGRPGSAPSWEGSPPAADVEQQISVWAAYGANCIARAQAKPGRGKLLHVTPYALHDGETYLRYQTDDGTPAYRVDEPALFDFEVNPKRHLEAFMRPEKYLADRSKLATERTA